MRTGFALTALRSGRAGLSEATATAAFCCELSGTEGAATSLSLAGAAAPQALWPTATGLRREKELGRVACLVRRLQGHARIITTSIGKSIISYGCKSIATTRQQMLSDELIAKIGDSLDAMSPKPASRRELDVLVSRIEGKIRAAQERGATYAEIAKQISESGYPIKTNTLRLAVQRRRKQPPDTKKQGGRNAARRKPLQTRNGGSSAAQRPDTKKP